MAKVYDNWERLVEATLRREQLWQLFHQDSSTCTSTRSSDVDLIPDNNYFANSVFAKSIVIIDGGKTAVELRDHLGSGAFGSTYIAGLKGITMAVKKLRRLDIEEGEFRRQMEIVKSVKHENVVPLRGYSVSDKDESFMLYDYYPRGSVHSILHAKGSIPLNWGTRLRIAIGAAKGIAHIHERYDGKLVHGNIKASNIFLNSNQYGCVSELGLATLLSPIAPPVMATASYGVPEVSYTRVLSQTSDVYCFGILLLELVTRKSSASGRANLVKYVNSSIRKKRNLNVLDIDLLAYSDVEEEMMNLLQIGISCVGRKPEQRPNMHVVVKMLENVGMRNH